MSLGVTSIADLLAKLKTEEIATDESADAHGPGETERVSDEGEYEDDAGADDATGHDAREDDANGDTNNYDGEQEADDHDDSESHDPDATPHEGGSDSRDRKTQAATNGNGENRKNQRNGERTFVSYVATHPEDDDDAKDPDGLAHAERMALETKAIALIRAREPFLKTTPTGNKGFDLIETDANDEAERWVEVKAMKGSLEDRPVGLSSVQFEFARQHGDQYWLYVVEYAGDPARARILKIKDPVGRSGTFTFDKGWSSIAQIDLLSSSAAEKA